jgi:hypothetical protein
MVVKRIGIGSAAKLSGAIYGSMGLIFGFIFFVISLFGAGLASQLAEGGEAAPAWLGALFGAGAIVLFPLLYGFFGFILGAISAGLYNLFARLVGGLVVELQ